MSSITTQQAVGLQGPWRRVVFVGLYETIAIIACSALFMAIGQEGGIAAMLIPLMAWWFDISLWQAAVLEAGILTFFLIYTYVFNWAFDRIFGLPASAQVLQPQA